MTLWDQIGAFGGLALGAVEYMFMLAIPYGLSRRKSRLLACDFTWSANRYGGVRWAFLVLVMLFVWGYGSGAVLRLCGLWHGVRSLGRGTGESRTVGLELFQFFSAVLLGPCAEEVFWRVFALTALKKVLSPLLAILAQAGLYAALHFYPVGATVMVFGYGVILGYWRHRFGSLQPIVLAHVMLNFWAAGGGVLRILMRPLLG
jgi:membrane protease YdiL (CAAX protease family)